MANEGNDQMLLRVAVFGITFSLIATMGISVFLLSDEGNGYSYDEIMAGRQDLIAFSGESMINQNPWFLTNVYTPWIPSTGVEGHIDRNGWLYGDTVPDYGDLNKTADIRLDPNQKSSVLLTPEMNSESYRFETGYKWWADEDGPIGLLTPWTRTYADIFDVETKEYESGTASKYNFTGYRYEFTPSLPFRSEASTVNGSLSLVWYTYNGQEGLSGGLQIYNGRVLLSTYSASDIAADYNISNAYATTYQFMFEGTPLTLSIRFDQDVLDNGTPLLSAWAQGSWSMAISSVSAGNFLDVEDSASFTSTAGSMIDSFIKIFTFSLPQIDNVWAKMVMWLMVGLPMTIAMLCVAMRMVSSIAKVLPI